MQNELQKAVHTRVWIGLQLNYTPRLQNAHNFGALGLFHTARRDCLPSTQPHPVLSLMHCGCSCHTIPKYQMLLFWCWGFILGGLVNAYGWTVLFHNSNNSRTVGNNWKLLYKHGTLKYFATQPFAMLPRLPTVHLQLSVLP